MCFNTQYIFKEVKMINGLNMVLVPGGDFGFSSFFKLRYNLVL